MHIGHAIVVVIQVPQIASRVAVRIRTIVGRGGRVGRPRLGAHRADRILRAIVAGVAVAVGAGLRVLRIGHVGALLHIGHAIVVVIQVPQIAKAVAVGVRAIVARQGIAQGTKVVHTDRAVVAPVAVAVAANVRVAVVGVGGVGNAVVIGIGVPRIALPVTIGVGTVVGRKRIAKRAQVVGTDRAIVAAVGVAIATNIRIVVGGIGGVGNAIVIGIGVARIAKSVAIGVGAIVGGKRIAQLAEIVGTDRAVIATIAVAIAANIRVARIWVGGVGDTVVVDVGIPNVARAIAIGIGAVVAGQCVT